MTSTTDDRRFTDVHHRMAEWLRTNRGAASADAADVADGADQPLQAPPGPARVAPREAYHSGFRMGRDIARERCAAQVASLERQLRNAQELLHRVRQSQATPAPPAHDLPPDR